MEIWAALQFISALVAVVTSIAIILGQVHVIERAEAQKWLREFKEKVAAIR